MCVVVWLVEEGFDTCQICRFVTSRSWYHEKGETSVPKSGFKPFSRWISIARLNLITRRAVISRFCQRDGRRGHPIVPSFCGSACLPLLTHVAIIFRPTCTHHPPTCQPNLPFSISSAIRSFRHFFFHSRFCSSGVELFAGKIAGIDRKLQMKSTTLERFLGVNGC